MKKDYGYNSAQNGACTTLTDSDKKDQEFKIIIKQNELNSDYIDVEITQNFKELLLDETKQNKQITSILERMRSENTWKLTFDECSCSLFRTFKLKSDKEGSFTVLTREIQNGRDQLERLFRSITILSEPVTEETSDDGDDFFDDDAMMELLL